MFVLPIGQSKPLKYPRFDLGNPCGFSFFIYRAQNWGTVNRQCPALASLINQSRRLFLLNKQLFTCKSCILSPCKRTITFTNTKLDITRIGSLFLKFWPVKKHDLIEQKFLWPVIVSSHCQKIILSPTCNRHLSANSELLVTEKVAIMLYGWGREWWNESCSEKSRLIYKSVD